MSELPRGWAWTTFGDIAETQLGKMLSAKARTGNGGRPYLRNKNVQWGRIDLDDLLQMDFTDQELDKFRLHPGDLLVCEGGEVGRAAIWRGTIAECAYQKALHRVRPRGGVLPEYLLYLLMHYASTHAFERYVTGSTIAHLPQEDLRTLPVPLPPLVEQRQIVAAIDKHVSRLEAAERSLADARSKIAGLRSATLSAATYGFRSVPLGELVAELRYGTSIKCSYDAPGAPVLRIPNVQGGAIDLSDLKYATDAQLDLASLSVESGDLLFVRTNGSRDLIGRVASVDGSAGMAFASYLIRARPDSARLDPRYAVIALSAPKARALIESKAATTAGQYNLNLAALRSFDVPLPSIDDQRSIVREVDHQLAALKAIEAGTVQALRRSRALRRAILVRAFRGQLVPQVPNDDPASALLARIAAERAAVSAPTRKQRVRTPA